MIRGAGMSSRATRQTHTPMSIRRCTMTLADRLEEVFDRGLREGLKSLSSTDRGLYTIQEFILDLEMEGLSGYFYNHLPNIDGIRAMALAMKRHGLCPLADLLLEAAELFRQYVEPGPPTTWEKVLSHYDPSD